MESIVQFLTVLVIFGLVLVITYLTTRWIGNYQRVQSRGINIELLDACRLSQGQYIQLLRIGDRYLAVAVSKDSVTLLCELSGDELVTEAPGDKVQGILPDSFREFLSRASKRSAQADHNESPGSRTGSSDQGSGAE